MTVKVEPLEIASFRREAEAKAPQRQPLPVQALLAMACGLLACAAAALGPLEGHRGDLTSEVVRSVLVLSFAVAGMTAVVRRPTERQGPLVVTGTGIGALGALAAAVLEAHQHATKVSPALVSSARIVLPVTLCLIPVAAMHFLLGLPDGSCRLRRSLVTGGYGVGGLLGLGLWLARPQLPLWPVAIEAVVAGAAGLLGSERRYAKSFGVERQRMQWFGWAVATGIEFVLVAVAARILWGWPTRFGLVLALATVPVAISVAMGSSSRLATRVDRMLAHTVSFAGLTGVVVACYVVVVVGLGRTPTRNERSLLALSMAAAAVAALLYGPARQRLTAFANRLVYGEREAPDTVLRTFGSRLSRAVPMDELLLQVAESLRKTLGLAVAEVWTGSGGLYERTVSVPDAPSRRLSLSAEETTVVARAGVSGNAWIKVWLPALLEDRQDSVLRVAPATHSGQVLGLVVVARRPGSDQFTIDDDTMLTELARQLGLALHNMELDSTLQATLDEVRRQADELQASRARIVAASDAARRQIERNLHDGAQQHLVALAVNVRLARKLADTDPAASAQILDQLGDGLQEAVQELRALAHGIYPPLLVDRGVVEALRSAAGRAALPTEVEAEGVGRYAPEVEAAIYFCCMEALQNAGKHAGPDAAAVVRIREEEGAVLFEVTDTGAGFDSAGTAGKGAGFVNMRDRVGAIGGALEVHSAPGAGTTISGRLPLRG
jgi:signal transduction histidine kinase